jgi:hypothetical protein
MFKTKTLRTRFAAINPLSTSYGIPGETVNVFFDLARSPLTLGHRFHFGEKIVPIAQISDFQGTVIVPPFVNRQSAKRLMIESPNGLRDIAQVGFQVQ